MKTILSLVVMLVMVFGVTLSARALLTDNEDGTVTQIRNDGSELMWLQDVNPLDLTMDWWEATNWISTLNSSNYLGYSDWRLPYALPVNGSTYNYVYSYDGSTDWGFNITSPQSELAYMFYVELGNIGRCDTAGNCPQPNWEFSNAGPFMGLQDGYQQLHYWTASEYLLDTSYVWVNTFDYDPAVGFGFDGLQDYVFKSHNHIAWAVRDVAIVSESIVPEPISSVLFVFGGAALGLRRFVTRKRIST